MAKAFNISDRESVKQYLTQFKSRGELSKRNVRNYSALKESGLLDEFLPSEKRGRKKKVVDFNILESISKNCVNRTELHKLDDKIYRHALRTGEIAKLFPNSKEGEKWTKDKVLFIASLCRNKSELNDVYRGAYNFASKNKILSKLKFAN